MLNVSVLIAQKSRQLFQTHKQSHFIHLVLDGKNNMVKVPTFPS